MYKVFFNQKPLILTSEIKKSTDSNPLIYIKFSSKNQILKAIKSKKTKSVYIYHKNMKKLWKIFTKKFPIKDAAGGLVQSNDDKFLFRITQEIENRSNNTIELYPYAQITRNQKPVLEAGSMSGTLILHDGFIGVFDEDLKEHDYDDIKDKKKEHNANNGWLGITDKFWITALVPEKDQPFRGEFVYKSDLFQKNN